LSIAWIVWLTVKRLADDEEGTRVACTVPTCPWFLSITESQFNTQATHHGFVKV
jgi:hypothetical protein